jgi:hypothetical protein
MTAQTANAEITQGCGRYHPIEKCASGEADIEKHTEGRNTRVGKE